MVLKVQNVLLKKHLQRQASRLGLHFDEFNVSAQTEPLVLILELEEPEVLEEIYCWKEKWPECFLALSVAIPDKELWIAAETAGADLIANRGALPRLVYDRLKQLQQGKKLVKKKVFEKAKPVMNKGEGLIGRLPDSTEDPIAVFKWKDQICAVRDICPHAGFSLADGVFDPENGTITCPEHGSRFQVCSGERLRGPADYPLKKYRAFEKAGEIVVEIEQDE